MLQILTKCLCFLITALWDQKQCVWAAIWLLVVLTAVKLSQASFMKTTRSERICRHVTTYSVFLTCAWKTDVNPHTFNGFDIVRTLTPSRSTDLQIKLSLSVSPTSIICYQLSEYSVFFKVWTYNISVLSLSLVSLTFYCSVTEVLVKVYMYALFV